MYLAFALSGVVNLVTHRSPRAYPPGTDFFFLAFAFINEGVAMSFHLNPPALSMRIHLLMVLLAFWAAGAVLLELALPHSPLASVNKCVAVLAQGSYGFHTGLIMYTKRVEYWDSMDGVMLVPTLCCAHIAAWLVVVYLLLAYRAGHKDLMGAGGAGSGSEDEEGRTRR
jgi:hypothetical protein